MEEILDENLAYYLSMTALAYRVRVGYESVGSDESDTHESDEHPSRSAKKQKLDSDTGEHSSGPANKHKLNSSRFVPSDLLRICSTLECTRDSLWVNIRDAGHFAGDVNFVIDNVGISGLQKIPGATGVAIPAKKLGTIKNIVFGNDITCILLIENYALYSDLWDLGYHDTYKCILINLSGQPDYLVREFIYHISSADRSLPVFCLCDLDLGGYFIVEGLRFGTPSTAFMHYYSRCKSLQWMGIVPSDIVRFQLQPDYYSDALFTDVERRRLNSHMAQFPHIPEHWKHELKKMANLPRKAKLQGKNILNKYLLPKLDDVAHWGER